MKYHITLWSLEPVASILDSPGCQASVNTSPVWPLRVWLKNKNILTIHRTKKTDLNVNKGLYKKLSEKRFCRSIKDIKYL